METHTPEVSDFIVYNETYKIWICSQHGYAIINLKTHLRDEHKGLSVAERQQLVNRHRHEQVASAHEVPRPPPHQTPIPGLAAPIPAFRCTIHSCGNVSRNVDTTKQHARKCHQWKKTEEQPELWTQVFAQTFFVSGGLTRYFAVRMPTGTPMPTPPAGPSSVRSARHTQPRQEEPLYGVHVPPPVPPLDRRAQEVVQRLKDRVNHMYAAHEAEMEKMDATILKQDRTGWYSRTKWQQHLAGRNLKHLAHATRLPEKNEPGLIEIIRVFNRLASYCLDGLRTLDQEARRWLRSEKQTEISPRPLARLQNVDSEDRYLGYMRRFLCYIFRLWASGVELAEKEQGEEEENVSYHVSTTTVFTTVAQNVSSIVSNTRSTNNEHDLNGTDSEDEDDDDDDDDDDDRGDDNIHGQVPTHTATITPTVEVIDLLKDARELFLWTDHQKDLVSQVYTVIYDDDQGDNERAQAVLEVFKAFIFHKVGGEKFNSGLVHFTAVLGIDEENRRLKEAVNFSYVIAGLIWDIRIFASEILMPSGQREDQLGDPTIREQFLHQRHQYLADGTGTPMSELINLLAYGKHVALNTSNAGSVTWSRDQQTMYFHSKAIPLSAFRSMVHDNLRRGEDLLWRELMWIEDKSDRFTVDLASIEDDVTFTRRGMSFLTRENNHLQHGLDWMLKRMSLLRGKRRLCTRDGRWRPRAVRKWLKTSTYYKERELFGVHSTEGPVSRGTEITAIRFRNGTLADRNYFIIDGSGCVVTRYHKSQQLFDKPKVIPRFPAWRVNQMMVVYLIYVQPLRELLLAETQNQKISDHIWHDERGPWETEHLTRVIKRETALGLGHRFNTLDFRHITISIGRVVVDDRFAQGYKDEIGEIEEPEQECEDPIELQSGRTEAMGASRYGVRADIIEHLSVRSLDTFRPLSEGWHRFLGLASVAVSQPTPSRSSSTTTMVAVESSIAPRKRHVRESWEIPSRWRRPPHQAPSSPALVHDSPSVRETIFPSPLPPARGLSSLVRPTPATSDQIEHAMHQLFGDGPVTFHSREQEEGVLAVLAAETPMTIVLPTGGGKTLLAMLPVLIERQGVTIFIAPFRALVDDTVTRFRRAGIDCFEWTHRQRNPARLVVVSADIAVGDGFMTYAGVLAENGLLRRVFVDEGHTTFTDSHWRKNLSHLRQVRSLPCPMYILTATLPPQRVSELEESMAVRTTRIIRASTIRPHHRYCVQHCRPGTLVDEAVDVARRQQVHLLRHKLKGVVYCLSKTQCEELAEQLGCAHYHAAVVDRPECLQRWQERGGLIVATSALGTGVDIPGIVFILHVDIPWSMIDYAQESGRGGRAGEVVDSMILVPLKKAEWKLQQGGLSMEAEVMAKFVTSTTCRRWVMSEYLDGPRLARSCLDDPAWIRCDRCGEGQHEIRLRTQLDEREQQLVEEGLSEMAIGCVYCWLDGKTVPSGQHGTQACGVYGVGGRDPKVEGFRQQVRYQGDTHSCYRCGISQHLCATGVESTRGCQWPGVVAPVLYHMMQKAVWFPEIQLAGYNGGHPDWRAYQRWLGQRHFQRVWGENMSNAMVVVIRAIRHVRLKRNEEEEEEDASSSVEDEED